MTWVGWVQQTSGELERIASPDEPEDYSETHEAIEISDEQYESLADGSAVWDPLTRAFGPAPALDLTAVKDRQWQIVKKARDATEWAGFDMPEIGRFDSDPHSQSKIIGAVLAAQIASGAGQPYAIEWTLQDNSTAQLDGAQMVMVGLALMAHVDAVHQHGRSLREQIESASTVESVQAVMWDW